MKKKYRDITVNGKKYAWQVRINDDNTELIIWYNKVILSSSDVSTIDNVTPKYVSDVIKTIDNFDKIITNN